MFTRGGHKKETFCHYRAFKKIAIVSEFHIPICYTIGDIATLAMEKQQKKLKSIRCVPSSATKVTVPDFSTCALASSALAANGSLGPLSSSGSGKNVKWSGVLFARRFITQASSHPEKGRSKICEPLLSRWELRCIVGMVLQTYKEKVSNLTDKINSLSR